MISMQKCKKARNTNRVIYISYILNPQFSSFSGMLSAVVERQILKMLYQFHRLLLRNRRLNFPHTSDISGVCGKYITSTSKIQDGSIQQKKKNVKENSGKGYRFLMIFPLHLLPLYRQAPRRFSPVRAHPSRCHLTLDCRLAAMVRITI